MKQNIVATGISTETNFSKEHKQASRQNTLKDTSNISISLKSRKKIRRMREEP